jgi:hypothetical protein
MKTINMVADTIQQLLTMIQNFVSAGNEISVMTKEAMESAAALQRQEAAKSLAEAK